MSESPESQTIVEQAKKDALLGRMVRKVVDFAKLSPLLAAVLGGGTMLSIGGAGGSIISSFKGEDKVDSLLIESKSQKEILKQAVAALETQGRMVFELYGAFQKMPGGAKALSAFQADVNQARKTLGLPPLASVQPKKYLAPENPVADSKNN